MSEPFLVPSGKLIVCYWKLPIEIVDLPINNGDFPWFFVNVYQRVISTVASSSKSWPHLKRYLKKRSFRLHTRGLFHNPGETMWNLDFCRSRVSHFSMCSSPFLFFLAIPEFLVKSMCLMVPSRYIITSQFLVGWIPIFLCQNPHRWWLNDETNPNLLVLGREWMGMGEWDCYY